MVERQDNYSLLIQKLDEFIRKYYKNQLIRGAIYFLSLVLLLFLFASLTEYFFHLSTSLRTILFYGFLLSSVFILIRFVVIPLIHFFRIGKVISHKQAAQIIGNHFRSVKDKLLNTLQLHENAHTGNTASKELILASINQKIIDLKPVPFSAAIDLRQNRRYLKYLLPPLMVIIVILAVAPSLITESTARLIDHKTYYQKPLPFTFEITNDKLEAVQNEDFLLDLKVKGDELPDNVFLQVGNNRIKMNKENNARYNYTFKNVQKNISFLFLGAGYSSGEYELKVLPNPSLLSFKVNLQFPKYLEKSPEVLRNAGDLIIPEGTVVNWNFNTRNTNKLTVSFRDTIMNIEDSGNDFEVSRRFRQSNEYVIVTENDFLRSKDSLIYTINVIPDLYPTIEFEQAEDSFSTKRLFFKGIIKDDYGLNKLTFNYRNAGEKEKGTLVSENIRISQSSTEDFFYMWDLADKVNAGDELEYYFEVWDNDGVNGSKSTKSQVLLFKAPTLEEIAEKSEKKTDEIKSEMKKSISETNKIQKDISDIQKKLLEKKDLSWEDRKKIEDILNNQKQLENRMDQLKQENQKKNTLENEYKQLEEEILEKQKRLQELMDKVVNEELKKLMEELESLLQMMDKQKLQEMLEKMQMNNKDVLKELDRTLELFKQLEFEQKLNEAINELRELSKKQEELAEKSNEKNADNEELNKEQEGLNENFDKLSDQLKDLDQKNQDLQFPNQFDPMEQDQQNIQNEMNESSDQLQQGKNKKASQNQKNASQKMKEMADKLQEAQQSSEAEQNAEDLDALRELLENLIKLSFDQEKLMEELKTTDINDPRYLQLSKDQRKMKDDAKMVEDSLFALSKRVPQIESVINKEIALVNMNMENSLQNLQDRQTAQARSRQQFAMTSINNLALLLSEVMDALQQQMAQQMEGNQQCQKPGSGKPSPSSGQLKRMQQQLSNQIKQLQEKMKGGNMPQGKLSEELARLAAQQEAIRNELQRLNQENNKDGRGSLGDLDKVQQMMDQNETDLLNKKITQETIRRQEDILTRLLEAENAERERDQDEKREAREGKDVLNRNQLAFEEYKRLKMKETELLKSVPPALHPFYRRKVNEYFQNINN